MAHDMAFSSRSAKDFRFEKKVQKNLESALCLPKYMNVRRQNGPEKW